MKFLPAFICLIVVLGLFTTTTARSKPASRLSACHQGCETNNKKCTLKCALNRSNKCMSSCKLEKNKCDYDCTYPEYYTYG